MISDKTVDLLTRIRGLCEGIAETGIDTNDAEGLIGTAKCLDVLTDIMDFLMTANAIEQRALLAKKCGVLCGGDVADAVNRVFGNNDKEETVN